MGMRAGLPVSGGKQCKNAGPVLKSSCVALC